MDNWRSLILVTETQKQEMAQAARQARMLRDLDGARRASSWLLRFVALTLLLLGMIALWAH